MMRKFFKTISKVLLCAMLACSMSGIFSACTKLDPVKTLTIGNFNGGVGQEWLQDLSRKFMDENPDCTVVIKNQREQYNGDTLLASIAQNPETLYFTTEVSYEQLTDKGLLEDITSVVEAPITLKDGTTESSIEEKMFSSLRGYFKRVAGTQTEAKYYAVPFFTAVYGVVYDRDLFNTKKLLETDSNKIGYQTVTVKGKDYAPTVGPDFKAGTYDDGLPRTWEDMKLLMKTMRARGVIPFTWAGSGYEYYRRAFERAAWASYEGYNDFMLNYSFDGTDNTLGKIDNNNGYLLQKQEGKLAAVTMARDIAQNTDNYSSTVFNTTQSHTAAHNQFLLSAHKGGTTKPIGMMLEGGWWENETRDTGYFREMASEYGEEVNYGKRDFRFMPIPRFIGTEGISDQGVDETTLYADGNTMAFVNNNAIPEQKEWAHKFLQFATRNDSLSTFTRITGVAKPYTYTLLDSDYDQLTPFCKSMWDAFSAENMQLTTTYNLSKLRFNNTSSFAEWDFGSKIDGISSEASDPLQFFSPIGGVSNDGNKTVTAKSYFDGMSKKFTETWWSGLSKS